MNGSIPAYLRDDDWIEAPSSEATKPGGEHGPIPMGTRPSLDAVLAAWDAATWGNA